MDGIKLGKHGGTCMSYEWGYEWNVNETGPKERFIGSANKLQISVMFVGQGTQPYDWRNILNPPEGSAKSSST